MHACTSTHMHAHTCMHACVHGSLHATLSTNQHRLRSPMLHHLVVRLRILQHCGGHLRLGDQGFGLESCSPDHISSTSLCTAPKNLVSASPQSLHMRVLPITALNMTSDWCLKLTALSMGQRTCELASNEQGALNLSAMRLATKDINARTAPAKLS